MAEHVYSKGDIVWGKIRGHPWWPAQITKVIFTKRGKSLKQSKYKCSYINDSTHSELCPLYMKPFRDHYNQLSKKIKQRSLKDAIKIADQRDKDKAKGKFTYLFQILMLFVNFCSSFPYLIDRLSWHNNLFL
jgi:hypothetical protein